MFYASSKMRYKSTRKFRNFTLSGDEKEVLIICAQCHKYLTINNTQVASEPKYV